MRVFSLLPLLSLPLAWSLPANEFQNVLSGFGEQLELLSEVVKGAVHVAEVATEHLDHALHKGQDKVEQWTSEGKEFVKQNGLVCE